MSINFNNNNYNCNNNNNNNNLLKFVMNNFRYLEIKKNLNLKEFKNLFFYQGRI